MFLVPSCAILFWMSRRSCSVTQNSMRIGLVRSAIGYSPPQTTTDNFLRIGGDTRKNIPFHISTDSFGQKLGTCSEKFFLPLYNGHSFRRLAGRARVIFWNRIPLLLYNRQYFVDWGDLSKILFTLQRTFSPRKTGVRLKKVKIKMLPALGKAEASYSVDMRF